VVKDRSGWWHKGKATRAQDSGNNQFHCCCPLASECRGNHTIPMGPENADGTSMGLKNPGGTPTSPMRSENTGGTPHTPMGLTLRAHPAPG
jgi:hypothetical protein